MAVAIRTKDDKFSKRALQAAGEMVDERTAGIEQMAEFTSRDECVVAIRTLWERSQRNFITIGKYLLWAKKLLPRGEYDEMIRTSLPFSRSLAFMMRSVAEAIETKRITPELCPPDYATAYQLVSLPDDKFELARQHELVRSTLTRKEITAWRREHIDAAKRADGRPKPRKALLKERSSVIERIEALTKRLAEIDRELGIGVIDGESTVIGLTPADDGN